MEQRLIIFKVKSRTFSCDAGLFIKALLGPMLSHIQDRHPLLISRIYVTFNVNIETPLCMRHKSIYFAIKDLYFKIMLFCTVLYWPMTDVRHR